MKKVKVEKSNIEGKGLFANEVIKKGDVIGVAHHVLKTKNYEHTVPTAIIGRHHNHSDDNPNTKNIINGDKRYLVATKNIKPNEEITTNYYDTPHLEQPKEEWKAKKGGSVNRPKTRKLNSKKYSRSLEATNELFAVNEFFQKPKSNKRKIFNPNAKYYKKGGETDAAFDKKLEDVAKRLKVSKADLIGIMKHESGLNPAAVNRDTGATGLIQFMPATAKAMGTNTAALRGMSAVEQLDYVEKFYKPIAGKAKDIGDLYMFTFLPAAVGKSNDFVIGSKGSGSSIWGINQDALYRQNAGFDKDKKGYYTVGDVKSRISKFSGQPLIERDQSVNQQGQQSMTEEEYKKLIEKEGVMEVKNPEALLRQQQEEDLRQRYKNAFAGFELDTEPQPQAKPNIAAIMAALAPKRAINAKNQAIQLALDNADIQRYVKGGYIVEESLDKFNGGGMSVKGKPASAKTAAQIAADKALDDKLAKLTKSNAKVPGAYKADPIFQKVANQTKKNAIANQESKKQFDKMVSDVKIKLAKDPLNYKSDITKFIESNTVNYSKEELDKIKQEENAAVQKAVLSKGMLNNSGKLDPDQEEYIRNQVRENYKLESDEYKKTKAEIETKTNIPLNFLYPSEAVDKSKQYLFVQNDQQKAKENLDKTVNKLITSGDAYEKYKNDNSGKDYDELIKDDIYKAVNENKDPNKVIEGIADSKAKADYSKFKKEYDELPMFSMDQLVNPFAESKSGLFLKDFLANPTVVADELIWDQNYMPGSYMALRDEDNVLNKYYNKELQTDQATFDQGIQYINPFSSAAEGSVAMSKGNYGDAALQLGEGVIKTAALTAAPELFSAASQVYVPGAAAVGLPGLSLASAVEIAGVGYGVTQIPQTAKAIGKAIETGKKEDIRSAVNQTMINGLDFVGIGDLAKITKTPEKLLMDVLMDSNTFRKEAQSMMKIYDKDPALYASKLDDVKQNFFKALDDAKVKYADEGYGLTPEEILADPSKAQYVKSTFDKYHAESMAYLKSDEGRGALDKMLRDNPEYAQTRKLKSNERTVPEEEYINKLFETEGTQDFVETAIVNLDQRKTQINSYLDELQVERSEIEQIYTPEAWETEYARVDKDIERLQTKLNELGLRQDEFNYIKNNDYDITSEYLQSIKDQDQSLYYQAVLADKYSPFRHPLGTTSEKYLDIQNMTPDDIIKYYGEISYKSTNLLTNDAQRMVDSKQKFDIINKKLMQIDSTHPNYQDLRNEYDHLWREMNGYNNTNLPINNAWYNTMDNTIAIGNNYIPGKSAGQTIAHEVGHAEPWEQWHDSPGRLITRSDGLTVPYSSPTDKILADITLYDDVPDFIKQEFYKTKLKPKKYIPQNVDELSTGQNIYNFSGNDYNEVRNNWNRNAKTYFLDGSNGNEKTTFMVELKHAMMDEGYGTRGAFTDKQLQKFWKDYISKARTGKVDRHRQRILDIAIPDDKTRKAIVEALNMPNAFEEGGSVNNYNLGDEVDEATMNKLIKLGYTFQKI